MPRPAPDGGDPVAMPAAARSDPAAPPEELSRRAYRSYRRTQAAELLRLVPPEAVRSLYVKARRWAVERGAHDGKDPMDTLLRYFEHLLPLPPFRSWLRDASRHPAAHVREHERRPAADPAAESVPVEVRSFECGDGTWFATLSLYRDREAWRGFLSFHRGADTPVHRTSEIFREESPEQVRTRFRGFDAAALRAFLRSVRP